MVWLILSFPEGTTMDQSAFRFTEYDQQTETEIHSSNSIVATLTFCMAPIEIQNGRHIIERAHTRCHKKFRCKKIFVSHKVAKFLCEDGAH